MSEYKLSICTIAKDEGPYLLEWLEFHKLVGVEHFYFYDNESTDCTKEILEFYINSREVTYHYWPGGLGAHNSAVEDCRNKYGHQSEWIALLDLDEFLFSPKTDNLKSVLDEYKEFPAVAVNWLTFGSSGHDKKPQGLQIENFIKRAAKRNHRNRVVKLVYQPSKVNSIHPHKAEPVEGTVVTENREPYLNNGDNRTIQHSSQKFRINHYITRSQEERLNKPRWRAFKATMERFQKLERECNEIEDFTIQRFAPTLKLNIQQAKLYISNFKLQEIKKELKYVTTNGLF